MEDIFNLVKPLLKTWGVLAKGGIKFSACCVFELQRELSDAMKQKIRAEYEGFGGSPDKPLQSNYFLNIIIVIAALALLSSLVVN